MDRIETLLSLAEDARQRDLLRAAAIWHEEIAKEYHEQAHRKWSRKHDLETFMHGIVNGEVAK